MAGCAQVLRPSECRVSATKRNKILNILEKIVAQKRIEVAELPKAPVTSETTMALVKKHGPRRNFFEALSSPQRGGVALIAEVKKASPSAGVICPDFDPLRIAREYEAAGASCISVLTDEKFFQGSLAHLLHIHRNVKIPVLRKDFIIDARQIVEAVQFEADAILLIVAILTNEQLKEFISLAHAAGLAALVEVHTEAELDRALNAGARLIGVNNRDLKTFKVDLDTTERIVKRLHRSPAPHEKLVVAESGIQKRKDVEQLAQYGVRAVLVGEALMRHGCIADKIGELLAI